MAVGQEKTHVLLHRREARRFPESRARSRVTVPHANRAQADRCPRRGKEARWNWTVRPPVLFRVMAARAAPRESWCCKGTASLAQSGSDLWCMRQTHVLPSLRARILRAVQKALSKRRESRGPFEGRRKDSHDRHLPRARSSQVERR